MRPEASPARIWAVGGGKGGTGKSVISVLLSTCLARLGNDVMLVDADLGCANVHSLLGLQPPRLTLTDFVERRVASLDEIVQDGGIAGLRFLAGSSDTPGAANPKFAQKARLIAAIQKMPSAFVVLDLGAGTDLNTLDMALAADRLLVVTTPQMTSIENAYGFVKSVLMRSLAREFDAESEAGKLLSPALRPEKGEATAPLLPCIDAARAGDSADAARLNTLVQSFQPVVLVNQARGPRDANAAEVIRHVCQKYLGLTLPLGGVVPSDPTVLRAIESMSPLQRMERGSDANATIYEIASKLLGSARASLPAVS